MEAASLKLDSAEYTEHRWFAPEDVVRDPSFHPALRQSVCDLLAARAMRANARATAITAGVATAWAGWVGLRLGLFLGEGVSLRSSHLVLDTGLSGIALAVFYVKFDHFCSTMIHVFT